jgi:hypothetical protein
MCIGNLTAAREIVLKRMEEACMIERKRAKKKYKKKIREGVQMTNDDELVAHAVEAVFAAAARIMPAAEEVMDAMAIAGVASYYLTLDADEFAAFCVTEEDRERLRDARATFDALSAVCANALARDAERPEARNSGVIRLSDWVASR